MSRKPNPMSVSVSRTGRVTIKIDIEELSGIVTDAATTESQCNCQPSRKNLEELAAVISKYWQCHYPNAPESELNEQIRRIYTK